MVEPSFQWALPAGRSFQVARGWRQLEGISPADLLRSAPEPFLVRADKRPTAWRTVELTSTDIPQVVKRIDELSRQPTEDNLLHELQSRRGLGSPWVVLYAEELDGTHTLVDGTNGISVPALRYELALYQLAVRLRASLTANRGFDEFTEACGNGLVRFSWQTPFEVGLSEFPALRSAQIGGPDAPLEMSAENILRDVRTFPREYDEGKFPFGVQLAFMRILEWGLGRRAKLFPDPRCGWKLQVENSIGVAWYALGSSDESARRCLRCGTAFTLRLDSRRRHKIYCDSSCQVWGSRKRAEAKKLKAQRGWGPKRVARELGLDPEIVKELLRGGLEDGKA